MSDMPSKIEIKKLTNGSVDEICADNVYLEYMDSHHIFLRIAQGKEYLQVWLKSNSSISLSYEMSENKADLVEGYQWVDVERVPSDDRLVECVMEFNNGARVRFFGRYVREKELEADVDAIGFAEYDEASDTFYCPEGWYECAPSNWDIDVGWIEVVEGKVIAWRECAPLPTKEG